MLKWEKHQVLNKGAKRGISIQLFIQIKSTSKNILAHFWCAKSAQKYKKVTDSCAIK